MIVVDASADSSAELPPDLAPEPPGAAATPSRVTLVRAPGARSFGAAVTTALRTLTPAVDTEWLWFFHDDSAPAPDALGHLLRTLEHTASVAVAGVKQVGWDDPDELIEVGFTVSRSGRRMTGVEPGEVDQGQHDFRDDVLAVGLTGALVRLSVWTQMRGTDSTYGVFGDGLDLCRRVRLAGHRVVVVPRAVVRHAQATLTGGADRSTERDTTFGARLRSQLYFLATGMTAWLLPFFLVGAVLAAPVRARSRRALGAALVVHPSAAGAHHPARCGQDGVCQTQPAHPAHGHHPRGRRRPPGPPARQRRPAQGSRRPARARP